MIVDGAQHLVSDPTAQSRTPFAACRIGAIV
jgi:hypothetical protein